jgi:hypothetical protein
MIFVAIGALNCAVLSTVLTRRTPGVLMVCTGCLPMANILAVGLLLGIRAKGIRRFLFGFEMAGALSLAMFLFAIRSVFVSGKPSALVEILIGVWVRASFVRWPAGGSDAWSRLRLIGEWVYLSITGTLPLLVFAAVGGLFTAYILPIPPQRRVK